MLVELDRCANPPDLTAGWKNSSVEKSIWFTDKDFMTMNYDI